MFQSFLIAILSRHAKKGEWELYGKSKNSNSWYRIEYQKNLYYGTSENSKEVEIVLHKQKRYFNSIKSKVIDDEGHDKNNLMLRLNKFEIRQKYLAPLITCAHHSLINFFTNFQLLMFIH